MIEDYHEPKFYLCSLISAAVLAQFVYSPSARRFSGMAVLRSVTE